MERKTIAYILGEFPSHTETFILREALYINRFFRLYIFPLKKGDDGIDQTVIREFGDRLIYIPEHLTVKILWQHLYMVTRNLFWFRQWKLLTRNIFRKSIRKSLHRAKTLMVGSHVAEIMQQMQIQHVHAHFANYPAEIALLASQSTGIPFSFTAHAHDIYAQDNHLPGKITDASFVTTCTGYNKNWLDQQVLPGERSKIHLVYHGVNLEAWPFMEHPVTGNPFQILCIGRLIEKKGMIYLLKALEILANRNIPARLLIVGKGDEEPALEQYCREHELEPSVVFMGWQNPVRIRQLFESSDMFVLPSVVASDGDRDGIPNVILEAMASGVPVVSTPVSGIPEIIRNRFNGLLVTEKNSQQLAKAVELLCFDKQLRETIIHHARETVVEKFDSNQCNQLLKCLFDNDALANKRCCT